MLLKAFESTYTLMTLKAERKLQWWCLWQKPALRRNLCNICFTATKGKGGAELVKNNFNGGNFSIWHISLIFFFKSLCGVGMHVGNGCGFPPHWHCIPQTTSQSATCHYRPLSTELISVILYFPVLSCTFWAFLLNRTLRLFSKRYNLDRSFVSYFLNIIPNWFFPSHKQLYMTLVRWKVFLVQNCGVLHCTGLYFGLGLVRSIDGFYSLPVAI